MIKSIIAGTGAYIPSHIKKNADFHTHTFYSDSNVLLEADTQTTIAKFAKISGIQARGYTPLPILTSDMATIAAHEALANAQRDPEMLDYIIVAHNYGDRAAHDGRGDMVPSLASRVKHNLGIRNTKCIPYDLIFGCPGCLQGLIQADLYIRSGQAQTCLVIGAETLSRVIDESDRDSMMFSDGAGAIVLEAGRDENRGIISSATRSDSGEELEYIYSGKCNSGGSSLNMFLKMKGHKVYEYALSHVPQAMKDCLDKSNIDIRELKMIFLHQANEKMDFAIVKALYKLYGIDTLPENILPMNISYMGNNSVATVPILLHQVVTGQIPSYHLQKGDLIMLASVGAGMNINAITYRW